MALRSDRDGNGEVYVMNTDGSDVRRLTRDPHPQPAAALPGRPRGEGSSFNGGLTAAEPDAEAGLRNTTCPVAMNADGSGSGS